MKGATISLGLTLLLAGSAGAQVAPQGRGATAANQAEALQRMTGDACPGRPLVPGDESSLRSPRGPSPIRETAAAPVAPGEAQSLGGRRPPGPSPGGAVASDAASSASRSVPCPGSMEPHAGHR